MSRTPQKGTPDQWKRIKLKKICSLRSENYDPIEDGTFRYIGLEHIDSGDPNINRYGFEINVRSTQHRFYQSDILYGRLRPYLDKAVLANFEGICSSDILVIKPINNIVISDYLVNILHLSRFLKYITNTMSGTTLPRTKWKDLSIFEIDLPNYGEQKKIRSILDKVQNLISLTQKIIERLQILKKGLMQRLFTEGIGHTVFKETRLGKIPKEWEVVRIFDIGNVIGGGTPDTKNDDYWNGDILWATPTDITNYNIKYISKTDRKITREGLNSSSAKILPPYSLLLTSRATIGYCVINKNEICTNQGFQNIIPNEKINVEFLYYMIQSEKIQDQLIRYAYGSTFLEIPNKGVKKIKIPVPNLTEQESIAKFLSDLDNKIENEKILKKIIKKIKRGLMQDLLTGKKRVKIN